MRTEAYTFISFDIIEGSRIDDHGDMSKPFVLLQVKKGLGSIHLWHIEVQDNQLGKGALDDTLFQPGQHIFSILLKMKDIPHANFIKGLGDDKLVFPIIIRQ